MNTALGLGGVFLGGALPWLEAVVVIPAGLLAGLPVVPVIIVGAIGNLITVALAAFAGEELKRRWSAWRERRAARRSPAAIERGCRNQVRIQRLMERGGLPRRESRSLTSARR